MPSPSLPPSERSLAQFPDPGLHPKKKYSLLLRIHIIRLRLKTANKCFPGRSCQVLTPTEGCCYFRRTPCVISTEWMYLLPADPLEWNPLRAHLHLAAVERSLRDGGHLRTEIKKSGPRIPCGAKLLYCIERLDYVVQAQQNRDMQCK